jgi:hypothetical protein
VIIISQNTFGDSECEICHKDDVHYRDPYGQVCKNCFQKEYGSILLETRNGEYYGGHKAHLAGGLFSKGDSGKMFLTENYFIFARSSLKQDKEWVIRIPLEKVEISGWNIKESARRTTAGGFGQSLGGGLGLFGGVLHESGRSHQIVLPYADENGIPQEPRFAVSSFTGDAVKKWAEKIYEQIIKVQNVRPKAHKVPENEPLGPLDQIKKLAELKDAGAITQKEFEAKKKELLSKV